MRKDRNTQRRRNTQRNKKTELWEVLTFRGSGKRNRRKEAQNTDSEKIQPVKEWEWGVVNDVSSDGKFHKMGTSFPTEASALSTRRQHYCDCHSCGFLPGVLEHAVLLAGIAIWFLFLMRQEHTLSTRSCLLNRLKISRVY